jgi:copper chaperone CopZ
VLRARAVRPPGWVAARRDSALTVASIQEPGSRGLAAAQEHHHMRHHPLRAWSASFAAAMGVAGLAGCVTDGSLAAHEDENPVVHVASTQDAGTLDSAEPVPGGTVVLYVNGLGCPLCANNLEPQMKRVRGVERVEVDLGRGVAQVALSEHGPRPSPRRFRDAVEDAGFTLVRIETR